MIFFFYNSTTFGCSTTNLGSWVVGVIGNHTWKFQEFSKSITYNLGEKINCTETIGDQAAKLLGPLLVPYQAALLLGPLLVP